MLQLPRVGLRLLACKNGASPDCIIVVVVVVLLFLFLLNCSTRIIIVREADLSEFVFR